MVSVLAYLVHLDPWMALAALTLFVPQFIFVPLMQSAVNRRTGARVQLLRQLGVGVIARPDGGDGADNQRIDRVFTLDMGNLSAQVHNEFLDEYL